ncbi:hypothetical protein KVR01_001545 [Diaporthe batatas]|uniref:uncharacterized protein n=1 Tax=Diaporthe batatas TaxID=748121 RepID=UPI001D058786|nr:uncharacterized protein KVR01_001545 [Diaporthe batatas]KAG8168796.1 hypothetical protein KVR01_001545 [Diaporthe batatas]
MFGTKTLSSLKDFFPQIHQPLPLTRRESQLLLKTLTTSFRNNLDREHGYWNDNASVTSLKAAKNASAPASVKPNAHHEHHHRPIDRHVRAILSNPLFSYDRAAHNTRPAAPERDPMDVFDEAVAKGLMNPQRAAGVLKAKRHSITQSSTISVNETVAGSGTALRVIQWLRSHGHERDLSFVSCTPLIPYLTQFMVEEGLEEIAWVWLERLMNGEGPDTPLKSPSPAACILDSLVRAKALFGKSLDGGLTRRYNAIVKRVALMGIDTVDHLSRIGREKEADSIGNLLTDRFGLTLVAAFKPSLGTDKRRPEHPLPAG